MDMLKKLLEKETGPSPIAQLAVRLGISEAYVRMLINGTHEPGWRLEKDITALYNKEEG